MTKKEERAIEQIRFRAALNLPPFEKPKQVEWTVTRGEKTAGWFQNSYSRRVTLGWSDGMSHNPECASVPMGRGYVSATQGKGQMYATKLDALKAMRWEATEKVMRELAEIDAMIEETQSEVTQ